MKQEDQVFDEMIRQKIGQRSFGPPASGWEKAEKLIDASQPLTPAATVSGIKLITIIASFIATSVVVAGIVYVSTNSSVTSAEAPVPSNVIAVTDSSRTAASVAPLSFSDEAIATIKNDANHPGTDVKGAAGNNVLVQAPVGENHSLAKHAPENVAPGHAAKSPGGPKRDPDQAQAESPLAVNSPALNKEQPVGNPLDQNIPENSPEQNAGEQIPENNQSGKNTPPDDVTEKNNPGNTDGNPVLPKNNTEIPVQPLADQTPRPGLPGESNPAVSPEKNSRDSTQRFVPENNTETNPLAKADSINPAQDHQDSVPAPSVTAPSLTVNYWLIQAGATYVARFSNGDKSGQSINPVIGGGYNFWLARRWSLQAGLRYTFINNASDSSSSTVTTTYGFGVTNHYTETRMQRLHYFSLPIQAYWRINGLHSLTAGGAFNYLAYSENREQSYSENNGTLSQSTYRTVFGQTPGLNRFDGMFFAGYSLTIGQHFSAEATVYCGLADLKNNSTFGINRFERNKGVMVLLQYGF
ncbi:MAG TPA: outer membrane beta-barrel protein [Bacteroidia bacterium]|nr:outer membrane beta-barrel protein [Bacteroidia bacterium]